MFDRCLYVYVTYYSVCINVIKRRCDILLKRLLYTFGSALNNTSLAHSLTSGDVECRGGSRICQKGWQTMASAWTRSGAETLAGSRERAPGVGS